jgi:hypothetical protein
VAYQTQPKLIREILIKQNAQVVGFRQTALLP